MRNGGLTAEGWVGDTDPVLAAEDALRAFPADEVLVFESAEGHARWLEDGLLERAREILDRPLRPYRGGFQTFVRSVTLVYTPLAALVNLIILLVA